MFPLVVLIVMTGLVRLLGWWTGLPAIDDRSAATAYGLAAVFPVNVYAAGERRHPDAPRTPILPRTIAQVVFLAALVVAARGAW